MLSRTGEMLGTTERITAVHPETVVLVHLGEDEVHEVLLFRQWLPKTLVNTRGGPFDTWVSLNGTTRLGTFGGGRVFWGSCAFIRQVDIEPIYGWLVPMLIQLPTLVGPEQWMCGEELLWSWRAFGTQFYLRGDGVRWGLYGAGNTKEDAIRALEQRQDWTDPSEFFYSVGAVRLSSGLRCVNGPSSTS